MFSELSPILARIPEWRNRKDLQVERIEGLTNANYRVTVEEESFVLRVSGDNTEHLGINRTNEFEALKTASDAGIGPEIIHFIQPEGHLVTRWIEGRHWSHEEYRKQESIRLMTDTVKRMHGIPPIAAAFSPFQRVHSLLETAKSFDVPFPDGFERFQKTTKLVKLDQQSDKTSWIGLCHNDLVSVNFLYSDNENKITILDYEFAGMGDIHFDLATLVYCHDNIGPIPQRLEDFMLECYFGEVTKRVRRRLAGMKFMLMLFFGMWGLAQRGMQNAGLIEAVDGFDYLEYSQYLFEHDITQRQEEYLQIE